MVTITLSIPPDAKKFIKAKAALKGITMRDFVLHSIGWSKKNTTKNAKKNKGTIHEAIEDLKHGRIEEFASLEDWEQEINKIAYEARNED